MLPSVFIAGLLSSYFPTCCCCSPEWVPRCFWIRSRLELGPSRLAAVSSFDSVSSDEVEICQQAAEVGSGYKNGEKEWREQQRKCSQIFLIFFCLRRAAPHISGNAVSGVPGWAGWNWCLRLCRRSRRDKTSWHTLRRIEGMRGYSDYDNESVWHFIWISEEEVQNCNSFGS